MTARPGAAAWWLGFTAAMMTDPVLLVAVVVLFLFVRGHIVLTGSAIVLL